ncbi:unnamed protein product [marine sediment metagenome]|uniref:Uncharacterized protein n=1 Tax=marine sediment metagenome TaxID=412755 RepID=X1JLR2_9ZZZZ
MAGPGYKGYLFKGIAERSAIRYQYGNTTYSIKMGETKEERDR